MNTEPARGFCQADHRAGWGLAFGHPRTSPLPPVLRPEPPHHAAVMRRAKGCDAIQASGSSSSSWSAGWDGRRRRMSRRYAKKSMA